MRYPTRQQAEALLHDAEVLNPGPWIDHCKVAAHCAEVIAQHHPDLDADKAYAMTLLHDIGKITGAYDLRHVLNGYNMLKDMGYPAAAQICLTHSFVIQGMECYVGSSDLLPEETAYLRKALMKVTYDDYDRLAQLCDALAAAEGPCMIEQRLMDVAIRHGLNDCTLERWAAYKALKEAFEQVVGCNLYKLLNVQVR